MPLRRRLARALAGLALALPALDAAAAQAPPPVQRPGSPANLPPVQRPSAPVTPVPSDTPPPATEPAPPVPSDTPPSQPVPSDTPPSQPVPSDTPSPPVPSDIPPPTPPVAAPPPLAQPPVPSDSPAPAIAPAPPTEPAASPAPAPSATPPRDDPKRWRHGGFILDLQIGTGGCTRRYCSGDVGHDAAPGVRLGGFVGGNILGIIEVGIAAGWNTLRPRDVVGQNALNLYGLDPAQVQVAIAEAMNVPALAVDLSTLTVQGASSRALDIGPSLRIHFLRRGRGIAYAGVDVHYQLWRNRYSTTGGDLRLDFHGISVPLRAGGGVHVHKNLAIIGEFSYAMTLFVVGGIRHPMLSAVAPLQALEGQADAVGSTGSLKSGLPHFWNLSLALRLRF